jgi:hypothetical protein
VYFGRLMPGVLSSPLIAAAALALLTACALRQDRRSHGALRLSGGGVLRGA